MKRNRFFTIFTFLCGLLFYGCNSDDDAVNSNKDRAVVRLTAEYNATRTWLGDDNAIRWSASDQVSVNGSASTGTTVSEEGAVATFGAPAATSYYAFYPASMVTSYDATAHTYVIAFPATQTYKDNVSFSEATNPAVAASSSTYLTFSNVCGILRMPINTNMAAAKARLVCYENVSGAATVNPVNKTLTVSGTGKTIDLTGLPQTTASYTLNWVLPARTYSEGWKVQLLDANDNVLSERVGKKDLTISRAKITNVVMNDGSAIAFRYGIPVGDLYWAKGNLYMPTTTTYAFASAQQTFVNTYAGGYYFPFNCLNARTYASNNATGFWVPADDPCSKIAPAGKWRVPTESEMRSLFAEGSVWGTKDGVNGRYFGVMNPPDAGTEDNDVFLPAAGRRDRNVSTIGGIGTDGYYITQTAEGGTSARYRLFVFSSTLSPEFWYSGYRDRGESIRCVSDK